MSIVAGVDFGTASVRVSIVHSERGYLGTGAAEYPVLRDRSDANFAAQRHEDHCRALETAFRHALAAAAIEGTLIEALAVDTTGSTVIALDERLHPLGDYYLWCDHRAWREAAEITAAAREWKLPALDWCGGTYSSEWGFAKVLHWLRSNSQQLSRFHTAIEHCDFLVAMLCGVKDPAQLPRSICAMGHKWMWNAQLDGLPPDDFLAAVDPLLAGLRARMQGRYLTSNHIAGGLSDEWAQRLALKPGIPIPVGALDAHWDAIGAGCRMGDVVNVLGTSCCIMALSDHADPIPGIPGVVQGSIHPAYAGIETGLAAVGDLFAAIARRGGTTVEALTSAVAGYRAGQTGLLRIAWDNGDRSPLADQSLRGATLGWRLNHETADEFFAAIEGIGFHIRLILERLIEHGAPVARVINGGGIARRNPVLNQVLASILNRPVLVPATDTTGLGCAIFASLAAGTFRSLEDAQDALCADYAQVSPIEEDVLFYDRLFEDFRRHFHGLAHDGLKITSRDPACNSRME